MTSGNTLVICLLAPVTWAPPGTDLARWRAALAEDVVDLLAPLPMVRAAIAATPEDMALAKSIAWPSMPILEIDRATPRAALEAASIFAATRTGRGSGSADAGVPGDGVEAGVAGGEGDVPAAGSAGRVGATGPEVPAYSEPASIDGGWIDGGWVLDEDGVDAEDEAFERVAVVLGDAPDLPAMLIGKLLRPLTTRAVAIAPAVDGGLLGVATRIPVPDWLPDLDPETGTLAQARAGAPEPSAVVSTPTWHRMRGPTDLARLDPGLDGWETTRSLLSS